MKSDARVRRTKMLLREALLECMKSKQLKDITITEVCGKAEVNRATFYKHYKSCCDIADEIEQEQLEMFRAMLVEKKKAGEALLRDILVSIDKATELTGGESGKKLSESFQNGLIRTAMPPLSLPWPIRVLA